jgi:hypothetical protein
MSRLQFRREGMHGSRLFVTNQKIRGGASIMTRIRLWNSFFAVLLIVSYFVFLPVASLAQEKKTGDIILPEIGSGSVDAYVEALKSDVGAQTRKIMEVNMKLTEKEAAVFWPIYGRYDNDLSRLNYERAQQYDFYASNYKTISDEQAAHLLKKLESIERRRLVLDEKYVKEMSKALPARTVLRFVQIANQVDRLVTLKIMSGMPLVPKETSETKPTAKPEAKPKDKP